MSGVPRREAPLLILSFRTDVGPLLVRERSRGSATDRILKPVASDDGRKPNVCTGGHLTGTPFRVEGFGCDLAVSHAPDVSLPWGVLEAGLSFWCVPSRQPPANLRDQSLHHRTRRSVVTGLTAGPRSGAQAPPARHGRDGSPPAAPNLAHRQHTRHGGREVRDVWQPSGARAKCAVCEGQGPGWRSSAPVADALRCNHQQSTLCAHARRATRSCPGRP